MSRPDLAAETPILPEIPVGDWFSDLVDWVDETFKGALDVIGDSLDWLVTTLSEGFLWVPTAVLIALLALLGVVVRSWVFGVASALGFLLIDSMGWWEESIDSLALVLVASAIAVLIAIPLGILGAESQVARRILQPVLDFMQTMPAFVYLIPAVSFFRVGVVPGIVATIIFAMPPGVRLTQLGILQVDREVVEAGEAFGARPSRVLSRIKIPLAMPSIMAGINQVIMLALSMVVIAGLVGAGGLGGVVFTGISRLDTSTGFEGGLCVVILAMYLDRLTSAFGKKSSLLKLLFGRRRSSDTAEPVPVGAGT